MTSLIAWLVDIQAAIQASVSIHISAFSETRDWATLIAVFPLALGFGFVHALTPGHNKLVLATYVVGERLCILKALVTSLGLSAVHIGSAVLIAVGANWLVSRTITQAGRTPLLEDISRWLLVAIAFWMIWRAVTARNGHGHAHAGLLAFAAGLIPCPLTLFIMVLAISQAVPEAGVLFAVAMMIGVATVLCAVAAAAAMASHRLSALLSRFEKDSRLIEGGAGILLLLIAVRQLAR